MNNDNRKFKLIEEDFNLDLSKDATIKSPNRKSMQAIRIINNRDSLNPIGLKARYSLMAMRTNKTKSGKNLFERMQFGKTKKMLDGDIQKSYKSSFLSNQEYIENENKRKSIIDQAIQNLNEMPYYIDNSTLNANNISTSILKKKVKIKEALPNFNIKLTKTKSNILNDSSITANEKMAKTANTSFRTIFGSSKNSSQDKIRMNFTKYELSPVKKELIDSKEYKQRMEKALQYGKMEKYAKKDLRNIFQSHNDKLSIKKENETDIEKFDNDVEEVSFNEKKQLIKKYIKKHESPTKSIDNSSDQKDFVVKNRGYLPINSVIEDESIPQNEEEKKYNIKIVERNNQYVHSLVSSKKLAKIDSSPIKRKNYQNCSKTTKTAFSKNGFAFKYPQIKSFSPTPMAVDFKKERENQLIFSLVDNIKNLHKVDNKIHNILNSAYDEVYSQAYQKIDNKVHKIKEQRKQVSMIMSNTFINDPIKRNSLILDIINNK